ncbi:MAG TPA: GtrA family protein [Chthoniobacter sp.]|jgi:putative flippase GtrA
MSRASPQKIARFLISGGIVIAAYYVPYYSLTKFFGVWYLLSSVIASIISSLVNFVLQKLWTFENKSIANMHLQVVAFTFVSIGYTIANGGMLYLLVGKLHWHYLVAQIIVSSILGFVSYFISDWIFRNPTP